MDENSWQGRRNIYNVIVSVDTIEHAKMPVATMRLFACICAHIAAAAVGAVHARVWTDNVQHFKNNATLAHRE